MSIRGRLLAWLLPTIIAFLALISLFFYYNLYTSILKSFRSNLKSIVVSSAENIQAKDIEWIKAHRNDPDFFKSEIYNRYLEIFRKINTDLPIANIYIVSIEPVKKGETVLLNHPKNAQNPAYDGINPRFAFREVYLVDPENEQPQHLHYDFTQAEENLIYQNKEPFVTQIHKGRDSTHRFMTGYAPITDNENTVVALVAADLNLEIFDRIHRNAITLILLSCLLAILLTILTVFFIANKITKPVKQLNSAALGLAAGDYGEKISVKGPKEIVELSTNLNIMRECLLENMSKLKDSSVARERLYGEYECAMLLQHQMLDQVIDDFHHNSLKIFHIAYRVSNNPQGLLLDIQTTPEGRIQASLKEAVQDGFEGIYHLLKGELGPSIQFNYSLANHLIQFHNDNLQPPFIWQTLSSKAAPDSASTIQLEKGDYFVLMNKGISSLFDDPQKIHEWLSRIFRHFAKEGPDVLAEMITSELNFLTKKFNPNQNIHLVCFTVRT